MADYIYLLEHRLSADQQKALVAVREVARAQGLTVFLVGGAVRDLTSGSPVRDLDVAVQGNALQLKGAIATAGGVIAGELKAAQTLFARFPGGVRMEVASTLSVSYPKPGKPVYAAATIQDDLRQRDFTVNAMALSLNEGSYGLLMDPLNGVADIENRQLRLVSNYGFIEDPVRMIRAARFGARLGWTMDEKTQGRYETGKAEHYIKAMGDTARGYETEEMFHEEEPLRILRKLEEEGWMKYLFPALTVAKANVAELDKLREAQTQLQMRGIHPDAAAANFPLLTAKLTAAEVADLKKSFVRPGFVAEIEALEGEAKEFAAQLNGKNAALASQAWKLLTTQKPEAVLWVAYSSKSAAIQAKLKSFYTEWPKARQKVPYALMQEMRIVPELEGYEEIVEKLFYELMDGNLGTVEEMKAWLEQYSPPAPPPPVNLRRARGAKKEAKGGRGRKKAAEDEADDLEPVTEAVAEDDEDEVESEEEATEVMPLRGGRPSRLDLEPRFDEIAEVEDAEEEDDELLVVPEVDASEETQEDEAVDDPPAPIAPAPVPVVVKAEGHKPAAKTKAPQAVHAEVKAVPATKTTAVKAVAAKDVPVKKAVAASPIVAPAKKSAAPVKAAGQKQAAKAAPAKKTVAVKGVAAAKTPGKATGRR